MKTLFSTGLFRLSSGFVSKFKIDCDALTDQDVETLAEIAMDIVPPFREVISVPSGGDRLATAMEKRIDPKAKYVLVVDDVMTSGAHMRTAMRKVFQRPTVGLVIFDRGDREHLRIHSIFKINQAVAVGSGREVPDDDFE